MGKWRNLVYAYGLPARNAEVAKLVDALGLGPSGETRESSNLSFGITSAGGGPYPFWVVGSSPTLPTLFLWEFLPRIGAKRLVRGDSPPGHKI